MKLPVKEIFGPTIQGEGPNAGKKVMFIRFAGCDFKCAWCDTNFSVRGSDKMNEHEIVKELMRLSPNTRHVVITGGNPVIHDLTILIHELKVRNYTVDVETQGSMFKDWLNKVDLVVVSPKGPSSGMWNENNRAALMDTLTQIHGDRRVIKTPIFDREDYLWWKSEIYRLPERNYLSVGNDVGVDNTLNLISKYHELISLVIEDDEVENISILPQLHVLVWGNKQGV